MVRRATGKGRTPQQTPREFAQRLAHTLRASGEAASLSQLPGQVVDLYYRVRYGKEPTSERELQSLNAGLDELGVTLRRPMSRTPSSNS
jgi:hypothetical protein